MAKIDVTIISGTTPSVSPDPVKMTVNDEIQWNSQNDFVVFFEKPMPFNRRAFHPGKAKSGIPKVGADPNKKYKYIVVTEDGEVDPVVIVQ